MKLTKVLLSNGYNTNRILLLIISILILIILRNKQTTIDISNDKNYNDKVNVKVDMIGTTVNKKYCEDNMSSKYRPYMIAMNKIYSDVNIDRTCYSLHKQCGWPRTRSDIIDNNNNTNSNNNLPLLVLSVGLEGSGHHYWTTLMNNVLECSWINGRHYFRDIGDGVPKRTTEQLAKALQEQLRQRTATGKQPCRSIFDAEDSFPTGSIRKPGRVFVRPDLVNLNELDGIMFNIKYLIILRNTTDTTISALRRNFFTSIDESIRTVENTLTYIESAIKIIPCHKIFIAHYEHILSDPKSYIEPLSTFLELDKKAQNNLKRKLNKDGILPDRKVYKLNQYKECKGIIEEDKCYDMIQHSLDDFYRQRNFMWPTFAGNGFNIVST